MWHEFFVGWIKLHHNQNNMIFIVIALLEKREYRKWFNRHTIIWFLRMGIEYEYQFVLILNWCIWPKFYYVVKGYFCVNTYMKHNFLLKVLFWIFKWNHIIILFLKIAQNFLQFGQILLTKVKVAIIFNKIKGIC